MSESVDLHDYSAKVTEVSLNALVRDLDGFSPAKDTDSGQIAAKFRAGVLVLDSIGYSGVKDKKGWSQNIEAGLSRSSKKVFWIESDHLREFSDDYKDLYQNYSTNMKLYRSLVTQYDPDSEIVFIDSDDGTIKTEDDADKDSVKEFDLGDYTFQDQRKNEFVYWDREAHQFIDSKAVIAKFIAGDKQTVYRVDRIPLSNDGTAQDLMDFFKSKAASYGKEMYKIVLKELDGKQLGGYIRQFYPAETMLEPEEAPEAVD